MKTKVKSNNKTLHSFHGVQSNLPEILFITSYPPRECGIATYNYDLLNATREKFGTTFSYKVCALEAKETDHEYPAEVKYILHTSELAQYYKLAIEINADENLALVFIQHEFGLFGGKYGDYFLQFLFMISKPVITTFHTVLPTPGIDQKNLVQAIEILLPPLQPYQCRFPSPRKYAGASSDPRAARYGIGRHR